MVHYSLDPQNPTKSCKSRVSNLHVHFKNTHETAQAIKGMHIQKATKYLQQFVNTMVELVGVPRPNSGAGHRVGGPKRVLSFCRTCLKMHRERLNLRVQMRILWSLSTSR